MPDLGRRKKKSPHASSPSSRLPEVGYQLGVEEDFNSSLSIEIKRERRGLQAQGEKKLLCVFLVGLTCGLMLGKHELACVCVCGFFRVSVIAMNKIEEKKKGFFFSVFFILDFAYLHTLMFNPSMTKSF